MSSDQKEPVIGIDLFVEFIGGHQRQVEEALHDYLPVSVASGTDRFNHALERMRQAQRMRFSLNRESDPETQSLNGSAQILACFLLV